MVMKDLLNFIGKRHPIFLSATANLQKSKLVSLSSRKFLYSRQFASRKLSLSKKGSKLQAFSWPQFHLLQILNKSADLTRLTFVQNRQYTPDNNGLNPSELKKSDVPPRNFKNLNNSHNSSNGAEFVDMFNNGDTVQFRQPPRNRVATLINFLVLFSGATIVTFSAFVYYNVVHCHKTVKLPLMLRLNQKTIKNNYEELIAYEDQQRVNAKSEHIVNDTRALNVHLLENLIDYYLLEKLSNNGYVQENFKLPLRIEEFRFKKNRFKVTLNHKNLLLRVIEFSPSAALLSGGDSNSSSELVSGENSFNRNHDVLIPANVRNNDSNEDVKDGKRLLLSVFNIEIKEYDQYINYPPSFGKTWSRIINPFNKTSARTTSPTSQGGRIQEDGTSTVEELGGNVKMFFDKDSSGTDDERRTDVVIEGSAKLGNGNHVSQNDEVQHFEVKFKALFNDEHRHYVKFLSCDLVDSNSKSVVAKLW